MLIVLPTALLFPPLWSTNIILQGHDVTVRKCRRCVRGNRQRGGVDYFKYSAVLNSRENWVLCALTASTGWSVHQTDITQDQSQVLRSIATFLMGFPLFPVTRCRNWNTLSCLDRFQVGISCLKPVGALAGTDTVVQGLKIHLAAPVESRSAIQLDAIFCWANG